MNAVAIVLALSCVVECNDRVEETGARIGAGEFEQEKKLRATLHKLRAEKTKMKDELEKTQAENKQLRAAQAINLSPK